MIYSIRLRGKGERVSLSVVTLQLLKGSMPGKLGIISLFTRPFGPQTDSLHLLKEEAA